MATKFVIIHHGIKMAEKEGFEPSKRDKPFTPLAGARLQPLGHFSTWFVRGGRIRIIGSEVKYFFKLFYKLILQRGMTE